MSSLWDFLKGKKTYIIAAASVAYAIAQYWAGNMDFDHLMTALAAAAGLSSLRHGVSTGA